MIFHWQLRWRTIFWLLLAFAVPTIIALVVVPWLDALNIIMNNTTPLISATDKTRVSKGVIWAVSFFSALASQGVALLFKTGLDAGVARMGPEELRSLSKRYETIADRKEKFDTETKAKNGKTSEPVRKVS